MKSAVQRIVRTALFIAVVVVAPAASACSVSPRNFTDAEIAAQARAAVRDADAIVDVEVDVPMALGEDWKPGLIPFAILKPLHVWKGDIGTAPFGLIYDSSCSIAFQRKGERTRLLLHGQQIFVASQNDHGLPGDAPEQEAKYVAMIDRLVGAPRPVDFTDFPGAIDPPGAESAHDARPAVVIAPNAQLKYYMPIRPSLIFLIAIFLAGLILRLRFR